MSSLRVILHFLGFKEFRLGNNLNKRFIIVGESEESNRVADLLHKTLINPSFIGLVSSSQHKNGTQGFIGTIDQINEIIAIYKIDEIIFCAHDIPAHKIIDIMTELQDSQVDYKIAPPESLSIIGSNSINTTGDLYVIDINSIGKSGNLRNKRLFDLGISLLLLPLSPILMFFTKKPAGFIVNIFKVIFGLRTWVGYSVHKDISLPKIKKGILNPADVFHSREINSDTSSRLNMLYARDYRMGTDLNIIWRGFRSMGRII